MSYLSDRRINIMSEFKKNLILGLRGEFMKFYNDIEYIEMCKEAKEIQSGWDAKIGDYTESGILTDVNDAKDNMYNKYKIFLPRQDQLQGMIKGDFIETCDYIGQFSEKFVELKTPEKILLKIIMQENYHKTWDADKKEWIAN